MLNSIFKPLAFGLLANPFRLRSRLDQLARKNIPIILNLHRVAPDDGSSYRPLSPDIFESLIKYAKKHFELRTIETLDQPSAKPKMVISFDDGYLDFFTHAMPILERHGIFVNHNFIPDCIDSGLPPLNVIAQDFIGKAPRELIDKLDVPGFSESFGPRYSNSLSRFIKFKPHAEQEKLKEYLLPQFLSFDGLKPTPVMNLEQVKHAAKVHEIGAHSYHHASMEFESDDYLRQDVRRCREYFRTHIGSDVLVYAFPNGSCRAGQEQIVKEEGIPHVLFVGDRFVSKTLYRFTFDATTKNEVRYKATGRRMLVRT